MIKSLEVVIAILILFTFIFFLIQNVPEKQVSTNISERTYEILKLKAQDPSFRELVNDGNAYNVYDSLYNYMDVSYSVSICNGITSDCNSYNEQESATKKTINYYLFDINKTTSIMVWIKWK